MSRPNSDRGRRTVSRSRSAVSRKEVKPSGREPKVLTTMRQCPGIYFADEPSGRTAKIGGTGLGVWEVVRDFSRDQNSGRIRKAFPQLSQAQVTAALMYYSRYRDEVQAKIDANAALTPERIERQYPALVHFTR